MADKKQIETSKIDALYSWLSYDLQKMKKELMNEMKISSVQIGSLYGEIKSDKDKTSQAVSQEIRYSYKQNQTIYDGLSAMITDAVSKVDESSVKTAEKLDGVQADVNEKLGAMEANVSEKLAAVNAALASLEKYDADALAEMVKEKIADILPQMEETLNEIKYSYLQHQSIYEGVTSLINDSVVAKVDDVAAKFALIEQMDRALEEMHQKIAEVITILEDADYKTLIEAVAEKTEESVAEHSRKVLEAVAAIPVAENVDYTRIVDEVGDKVLELLSEVVQEPAPAPVAEPVEAKIDYDKIIYGSAEKVVESLPYPEKVDYRRIDDSFVKAVEKVQVNVGEDVIANAVAAAVEKAMAALDIDAIANAVAAKIEMPVVEAPEIDYDKLSDMVVAKLAANIDQTYDVVLDETGIEQIAEKVSEKVGSVETVDYDRISAIVDEKLANEVCEEETTYDFVIDDEGIDAIASRVAEQICEKCATCEETVEEVAEAVEEPVVEEVVEEPVVEEVIEEVVEEPVVEETVEEIVEEPVAEEPVASEEIAVAVDPVYEEIGGELVDAETGLVIRLKRSFTAKMKQSEENVKGYYSDIKNELTSYKKVNSNVSWHGDRFNFGRETVAKMAICGKTLCFYLSLDPENPDFKQTVYHQKNVGDQKAHENTPFMVKIKSDAAAKKAVRLIAALAEKIGAEKKAGFEPIDYVEEFAYASTKQLFDEGYIKVTKEKKVEFNF